MGLISNLNNYAQSILKDIQGWKEDLVDAITSKGGEADADASFNQIIDDVASIPRVDSTGFDFIDSKPNSLIQAYAFRAQIKTIQSSDIQFLDYDEAFNLCKNLESVTIDSLLGINGSYVFANCAKLQHINFENLISITGSYVFTNISALKTVEIPNLVTLSGNYVFQNCMQMETFICPSLVWLSGSLTLGACYKLRNFEVGTLRDFIEPFGIGWQLNDLRNFTVGQDTDVNIHMQNWTANNVINQVVQGIQILNNNLYNNLLTKLYDHSQDGETRTLRIGWLANVSQENIAYANAKGWTLTT